VLSGGGARGFAHIGVLKVLRELRVPVDMITATSMGSIVAGAYAAGRTPQEMEDLVRHADWTALFSDRPPRRDLTFRRKEDDLRTIGTTEFGIKKDGMVLPRGAIGTQNLEEFLRLIALPASSARHLDALPIPLRAVATDLVTGQMVVLRDVPLSVAMRASMSIPGAFAPTRVDDRLLADGGLTRNLPVEVAQDMGAEVVIAVNVGTPLLPRQELSSAFGVAQQMINILTEQNVGISLAALRPDDVLVSPDLSGISFVDFERGVELIARGEAAARAVSARLARYALDERAYAAWESHRTQHPEAIPAVVDEVRTQGTARTNPAALKREVTDRVGLHAGDPVRDEQLIAASRFLYGTGEFERVDVRRESIEGRSVVILDVDEKPWGPDYLRFGGYAVSNFRGDSRFSINAQHTRTWVNSWGAEWRNEAQIGDVRRLATGFYQPLGPGSPWFVEPIVEYAQADFDLFGADNRRTDRVTNSAAGVSSSLGRRLGNTGVARIGIGREWYESAPLISSRLSETLRDNGSYARLSVTFDTLDDVNFMHDGYLVNTRATSTRYSSDADTRVQTYSLESGLATSFGRLTFLGLASVDRSRDDRGGFGLGGFLNLSGTPVGAIVGSQSTLVALVSYYRMGELPRAVGRSWYLGGSLETGNAWTHRADIDYGNLRTAMSLFVGFDTVIGPAYVAWGHTVSGESSVYLFLGRPSLRE
jgi:NTE family protein